MIELEGASYSYAAGPGGAEGPRLLDALDLTLAPGSFHFLTGPSGTGKTTLLKLLYGDLKPTHGTVRLWGADSRAVGRDDLARARRRIGVVHQDCRFLDHLPIHENIALPLTVAGRHDAASEENLSALLDWVGLRERFYALPPELSGGERQRAALARAVIMDPEIIVADEPTGNVDWEMSQRLLALLAELNRMGKTILVATHDLALIRAAKSLVQARVLRLAGGRLTQAGADL